MTLKVLGKDLSWGQYRTALNANTQEIELRLQSVEATERLYSGTGVPANSAHNDGDMFINRTTWELYRKVSGSWVLQTSIIGPQGVQGVQGMQGPRGLVHRGNYAGGTAYVVDDAVFYRGALWRNIAGSTGVEPTTTNTTNWSLVARGFHNAGTWAASIAYRVEDVVLYGGNLYRVLSNHTSTTDDFPGSGTTNANGRYSLLIPKGEKGDTGPGGSVGIQEGGTLIGTRATLNFTAAGFAIADDSTNSRVNIAHETGTAAEVTGRSLGTGSTQAASGNHTHAKPQEVYGPWGFAKEITSSVSSLADALPDIVSEARTLTNFWVYVGTIPASGNGTLTVKLYHNDTEIAALSFTSGTAYTNNTQSITNLSVALAVGARLKAVITSTGTGFRSVVAKAWT